MIPLGRLLPRLSAGDRVTAGRVPVEEAVAELARHRLTPAHRRQVAPDRTCERCEELLAVLDQAWDAYAARVAAAATEQLLKRLPSTTLGRLP